MMFIVALLTIILMYALLYNRTRSIIRTVANMWILISGFVWASTELLSVFNQYTSACMLIMWLILLLVLVMVFYKRNMKVVIRTCLTDNHYKQLWNEYKIQIVLMIIFGGLILVGSGLHGLNNVDSLAYHLPRIMHWIANRSVWPYVAGVDLQIRYPALAEYLVAQVYFMGLPDRMASLPQACSFLMCGMMVYGIGRRMDVRGKTAFVGTYFFYCAPIALSQAFTTQTDNIAAMFLMVYIYFIMDFIQKEKLAGGWELVRDASRLAACVMLGYLCKPTICFAMIIFFIWMCIVRIKKKDKLSLLFAYAAVGIVIAVILYLPLVAKTYDIYYADHTQTAGTVSVNETIDNTSIKAGNVLAPDARHVFSSSNTPKKFAMSLLLNFCRSSSSAVFPKWNIVLKKLVNWVGDRWGYDISEFAIQEGRDFYDQDTASSPFILIGMVIMCIVLLVRGCRLKKEQKIFVWCAVLSFAMQCSLMTFTLYRGRYLVGVLALLSIAFSITIDNLKFKESVCGNIIVVSMVLASLGAVNTLSYEMFCIRDGFTGGHIRQYLVNNTWLEMEFTALFNYINEHEYRNIGLYGKFSYEYIAWKEIENLDRLEAVNVRSEYHKYEDMSYYPDCIIRDNTAEPEETIECHGREYKQVWSIQAYLDRFAIYIPSEKVN